MLPDKPFLCMAPPGSSASAKPPACGVLWSPSSEYVSDTSGAVSVTVPYRLCVNPWLPLQRDPCVARVGRAPGYFVVFMHSRGPSPQETHARPGPRAPDTCKGLSSSVQWSGISCIKLIL